MIDKVILTLLALLFPPLPVAIQEGLNERLLIAVALTLFGFIPGIIYALFVIWFR